MNNQKLESEEERRAYYREFLAQIQEDNAGFDAATPGEKRVIIARDVLAHLQAGVLVPSNSYGSFFVDAEPEDSLRDAIARAGVVCAACARGGIVFSTIMRRNRVTGTCMNGGLIVEEFPRDMMVNIEAAFEAEAAFSPKNNTEFGRELMFVWRELVVKKYESDAKGVNGYRLTAIMQWIIDHGGEFDLLPFLVEQIAQL